MIGKTVGDYRIIEKRGEGGMGVFFKAQDIRLDHFVGIKTIRAELLHEPEIIAKLEEEAKSLARLDHQNIARLLHYMVIDDQRYIVMEFVEGLDLAERLRRDGPLSLELMSQLVPQICAAIGYAHQRNVIHRDIKPSNILVTQDNIAKVTDFGISKILGVSTKTKTGVATGSLPYMAPEQIRGSGIDARTDIYQLGVMFFELLVGRRPFLAETEYDMMSHHLSTPPPLPSSINSKIPASVDRVLLTALAKKPDERFATTGELSQSFMKAASVLVDSRTVYSSNNNLVGSVSARLPSGNRTRLYFGIAIALVAILAFAKIFLFERPDVPGGESPTFNVVVRATTPVGMPDRWKVIERFTVAYPDVIAGRNIRLGSGRSAQDTLVSEYAHPLVAGDRLDKRLSMPAGESVRFSIDIFDPSGELLCRGERVGNIGKADPLDFEISMSMASIAADRNGSTPDTTASTRPDPYRRDQSRDRSSEDARTELPVNLTIDVQPFAERGRIESLWLDGKKQSEVFPLILTASQGRRTIRWQIGRDYWTDTVTVGDTPVEKYLIFELSRGRVNVAGTFNDGPGFAEILLDGQETGQGTPGELRDVAAGPHEITLKRDGYKMQGGPYIVRVLANDRARVSIPMSPR